MSEIVHARLGDNPLNYNLQGAIIPHRLLERDQVPHRRTCLDIVTRVEYELAAMTAFMTRKIKFDGNLKQLGVLTAAEK